MRLSPLTRPTALIVAVIGVATIQGFGQTASELPVSGKAGANLEALD